MLPTLWLLAVSCARAPEPRPGPGGASRPDSGPSTGETGLPTDSSPPEDSAPRRDTAPPVDTAPPDCRGSLVVELGTGETAFTDLPAELVMVFGPQGGWHLTLAARVHGVSEIARFLPTVTSADGEVVAGDQFPDHRELMPWDPWTCVGDAVNLRAFLPVDQAVICRLADTLLDVQLEVLDLETGALAEGRGQILARLDPRDEAICP